MNLKYYLLVAAAALGMGACTTDDTEAESVNGWYKISFTVAEDSDTRTTLAEGDILKWVPTDRVGIYTVGKNTNANAFTVADVNQKPVEFIGTLEQMVSPGDRFYAYYPYDAAQGTDPGAVVLTIPEKQKQTAAGVYDGGSHPLVAVPMTFTWEHDSYAGRISSVRFRQLGAIVELQLFSTNETYSGEKICSVTFEAENTPLAGDFQFDLMSVTVDDEPTISGCQSKKVTTSLEEPAAIPAAKDKAARVYLTIAPGTYTGKVVVNTDAAQYTFRLSDEMTFERAVIKGLPADLAEAERGTSINFADEEVKRVCLYNWNTDENTNELSYEEAAAVQDLGKVFKMNKNIASFHELRYFTGLKSIGEQAFYGCDELTNIIIPEGVTEIESNAFSFCENLTSITLPNTLTTIGSYAFGACGNLTKIELPEGVTEIGDVAFANCSSLTSIHIPQTVLSMSEGVFGGCSSLSVFSGKYTSANGRCLIRDGALLAFAPAGLTEYTIPSGVTAIGGGAFSECSGLTSIIIPEGVTEIGEETFFGCSSLANIDLPSTLTTIGSYAFADCLSLASIELPDGVKEIGEGTFSYCESLMSVDLPDELTTIGWIAFGGCSSLASITLPSTLTTIGSLAFAECSSLARVYCKRADPPTLDDGVFYETPPSMMIYVPENLVTTYKTAEGWSEYESQIISGDESITFADTKVKEICLQQSWDTTHDGELSYKEAAAVTDLGEVFRNTEIATFDELQYFTGLKSIGRSDFGECEELTSIKIPVGVTAIENYAFMNCSSLANIDIPNGVTEIRESAFSNCSSLANIDIPNGVTKIGESAFSNCSSLANIDIPDKVTEIGVEAFAGCSSLENITLPINLTTIGEAVFIGCTGLTNIEIPNGVTTIGDGAFVECSSLTSIDIPDKVTEIGVEAFGACSSLERITLPDGVTTIGEGAFGECSNLLNINIPKGVTTIEEGTFRGCVSLAGVHCTPTAPPTLGDDVFTDTPQSMKIYVPAASVTAYKKANGWSEYESQIISEDEPITFAVEDVKKLCLRWDTNRDDELSYIEAAAVTDLADVFMQNAEDITSFDELQYFTGLQSIRSSAFYNCTNLSSINLPKGLTAIKNYAFGYCTSLTSIELPDGVKEIGVNAFAACSGLTSIELPEAVTKIGSRAFYGCSNLASVYCTPATPPTLSSEVFSLTSPSMKIYVPAASVDTYKATRNWSTYTDRIFAENN